MPKLDKLGNFYGVFVTKSFLKAVLDWSKISAIGSLVVVLPFGLFLLYPVDDFVSGRRSFVGVDFRVFGSAKSPPTIVIKEGGKKIFFADCDSSLKIICESKKYWSEWHRVESVTVFYTRKNGGRIEKIVAGDIEAVLGAEDFSPVDRGRDQVSKGLWGLIIFFAISVSIYLLSFVALKRKEG